MVERERDREFHQRQTVLLGEIRQRIGRMELTLIGRRRDVEASRDEFGASRFRLPGTHPVLPGQPAGRERPVRQRAHPVLLDGREHLTLDPAHQQRVRQLLGVGRDQPYRSASQCASTCRCAGNTEVP